MTHRSDEIEAPLTPCGISFALDCLGCLIFSLRRSSTRMCCSSREARRPTGRAGGWCAHRGREQWPQNPMPVMRLQWRGVHFDDVSCTQTVADGDAHVHDTPVPTEHSVPPEPDPRRASTARTTLSLLCRNMYFLLRQCLLTLLAPAAFVLRARPCTYTRTTRDRTNTRGELRIGPE